MGDRPKGIRLATHNKPQLVQHLETNGSHSTEKLSRVCVKTTHFHILGAVNPPEIPSIGEVPNEKAENWINFTAPANGNPDKAL
ncbi:hypothetical protein V6N13_069530 [Hibiscus sabdariffa]|uniref:Uncharacterized protein n=1 Tax=Hibiscus sabdariffa TaxID=183260 RepID=A0ABR2PGI8_9ROSI